MFLDFIRQDSPSSQKTKAPSWGHFCVSCISSAMKVMPSTIVTGTGTGSRPQSAPSKLGYKLCAIIRVNLSSHGQRKEDDFARFVVTHPQIRSAFSVSGDADYLLDVRVRDLDTFADFNHRHLLSHPQVAQVRSEIVLKTLKDKRASRPVWSRRSIRPDGCVRSRSCRPQSVASLRHNAPQTVAGHVVRLHLRCEQPCQGCQPQGCHRECPCPR